VSDTTALQLEGISKRFGGVRALQNVEMSVPRGEVRGLAGANGSGKSTLVKILAGYHSPDSGQVAVWGNDLTFPVVHAHRYGIATIHQDLGLIDTLSITENVIQTTGFGVDRARPISWRAQRRRVEQLLKRLDIGLDPATEIGRLTRGERTLVAVARAICELEAGVTDAAAHGRHLLIMDEPTAALSSTESGAIYDLLRRVVGEGGAALFISHHVQEMRAVCQNVTILRDGQLVGTVSCADSTEADIVRGMLGAELAKETPLDPVAGSPNGGPSPAVTREPVLRVRDLHSDVLTGMSFDVAPGEIVGITGLLGMGQDDLPYVICGARSRAHGTVEVEGRSLAGSHFEDALDAGVALVPAERRRDGLWMEGSATENLGIAGTGRFWRHGHYDRRAERVMGHKLADQFDLRPRDPNVMTSALSGGNQQKVLMAKWLQLEPRVVLLHEPTQGVDVGAKVEIHRIVREFAERAGAAVVVFSSDHDEIAELCDRAIVMARGRAAGSINRPELSTHRIVEMANEVTQS
jgi:ribose transport system ATP-binding protein